MLLVASQPQNITLNFGEEVMLMNVKLFDAQRKDIPLNYKITHDMKSHLKWPYLNLRKVNIPWYGPQWVQMAIT